ncbi:MAG TPA: transglutaminase-like domain-containing protein, partial [Fimbriimonas sp.]|nr:transglutaminase-like domain-containing protein [Fimbriimonas sp.]
GTKVGYSSFSSEPTTFKTLPAVRNRSATRIKIGLIGSQVSIEMDSETITVAGKPKFMKFVQSSAGRKQTIEAYFSTDTINVDVDNNGSKTKQKLKLPKDGLVVDDPVAELALKPGSASKTQKFYVFDPSTVSLVANTLSGKPKPSGGHVIEISDPRMSTTVETDAKGEISKVSTTIGLEMAPATEAEALAEISGDSQPDLADLTSIKPTPSIKEPMKTSLLKLKLSAANLPPIPIDTQTTGSKQGSTWTLNIKPTQLRDAKTVSIAAARSAKKVWAQPSLLMPSSKPQFISLAKEIVGKRTDVKSASLAIRSYVNRNMSPNAGIGILRDASEIIKGKEGVCRDYAILTATLCRAAGIPTRLASGLANFDGNFYYHAWVEVWTGYDWVGMDSVPSDDFFSATHVKLSQGNVDQAFTFTVLAQGKIEVVDQRS